MKRKVDKAQIMELFETSDFETAPSKIMRKRPNTGTPKKAESSSPKVTAMQNNKMRFDAKLENEAFNEFDHKDWFQYFLMKCNEQGIKYLVRNYAKDYAVIKSIMNELSPSMIKNMMDFLFDSDQDMIDKRTIGIWALSKGWINSVYQNTLLWIDGDYTPKRGAKRNREWTSQAAEASRKDSGTGITYGKPIKDNDEVEDKPKKKKSVRIKF